MQSIVTLVHDTFEIFFDGKIVLFRKKAMNYLRMRRGIKEKKVCMSILGSYLLIVQPFRYNVECRQRYYLKKVAASQDG